MRAEPELRRLADRVRAIEEDADRARTERDDAIRQAIADGMSAYRVSQVTELDERGVGRIREKGEERHA